MRAWDAAWRAWLYTAAWLSGGIVLTLVSVWMVRIIAFGGWLATTQPQRLNILGTGLYLTLSGPLLVMLGLGLRNAIRNIKGSIGGSSFEANGRDEGEA